jgi:regulator of protease activity HflC (stomatin/prohibitin superfamily)
VFCTTKLSSVVKSEIDTEITRLAGELGLNTTDPTVFLVLLREREAKAEAEAEADRKAMEAKAEADRKAMEAFYMNLLAELTLR